MGDWTANIANIATDLATPVSGKSRAEQCEPSVHPTASRADSLRLPFHAQLDDLVQPRVGSSQRTDGSDSHPFDLHQMPTALPTAMEQTTIGPQRSSSSYNVPISSVTMMSPSFQYTQQMLQCGQQRHDPTAFARTQHHQHPQQHYLPQHFVPQAAQYQIGNRLQQLPQMQTQPLFNRIAYGMNQPAYSPVDMGFPQQQYPMGYGVPTKFADMGKTKTVWLWEPILTHLYQLILLAGSQSQGLFLLYRAALRASPCSLDMRSGLETFLRPRLSPT